MPKLTQFFLSLFVIKQVLYFRIFYNTIYSIFVCILYKKQRKVRQELYFLFKTYYDAFSLLPIGVQSCLSENFPTRALVGKTNVLAVCEEQGRGQSSSLPSLSSFKKKAWKAPRRRCLCTSVLIQEVMPYYLNTGMVVLLS